MVKRIGFKISQKVWDWYKEKADETGISVSALAAVAMAEYMDDKDTLQMVKEAGSLQEVFTNLEKAVTKMSQPAQTKTRQRTHRK
jgi:predicted regulator of amino acid metabolism with ACT domain